MSYGTCESAGEKAIGLDQDKRENWGKGGVKKRTTKQNGCRPTPHLLKGLRRCMNPILPPLQPNHINLLAHVFIYTQKAAPEGVTNTGLE